MVSFTQHEHTFSRQESEKWFALANKYYKGECVVINFMIENDPGSQATMTLKVTCENDNLTESLKKAEFILDKTPIQWITIQTGRIWSGTALSNSFPIVEIQTLENIIKNKELNMEVVNCIKQLVSCRRNCRNDIFYKSVFTFPITDIVSHVAKVCLDENLDTFYYDKYNNSVYLSLNNCNLLTITNSYVKDFSSKLTLDLDDGFDPVSFSNSMNNDFREWVSNDRNPNENILKNNF